MKRLTYLTLFSSLLINLAVVVQAHAKSYNGFLEKRDGRYYMSKNTLKLELKFEDPEMLKVIQRLDHQDYISVDAFLKNNILSVDSINYVGLRELLGFWKDRDGLCYYFSGYTNFKVFIPNSKISCSPKSIKEINQNDLTTYNYFINPNEDVWTMLISNQIRQYLAELHSISSTKKRLIMYNAEDGKKLPEVFLSRP